MEIITCLQGQAKEFGCNNDYGWKLMEIHFTCFHHFLNDFDSKNTLSFINNVPFVNNEQDSPKSVNSVS